MMPAGANEVDLIADCKNGDIEAFGLLVERYQAYVNTITYCGIGDTHKSEEVAQDVFVLAWKNISQLRDIKKFKSWLSMIAKNQVRSYFRKKSTDVINEAVPVEDANCQMLEYNEEPVDGLIAEEAQKVIWHSLNQLPEKYRCALILYYKSEKNIRDVALFLDISEAAAKKRLSRGRHMIKDRIAGYLDQAISSSAKDKKHFAVGVISAIGALGLTNRPETAVAGGGSQAVVHGADKATSSLLSKLLLYKTAIAASIIITIVGAGAVVNSTSNKKAEIKADTIGILPLELYDGLVMYLSFDSVEKTNGQKIVFDESNFGNDGVLQGGKIKKGKIGKALKCSAKNKSDGVIVKDSDSLDLDKVTIAAWIKTNCKDDYWNRILDKGWESAFNLCIGGEYKGKRWQENLYFEVSKNGTSSKSKVVDGEWHFVVGTCDSMVSKVYVDGEFDNKRNFNKEFKIQHNDVDIHIGQLAVPEDPPYDIAKFDGYIDEVRLYNRVLTAEEIKTLYSYQPEQ